MEQVRWAKEELKTLDIMTRKVLTMNDAFYSKRDVISCEGYVRGGENS